MPDELRDFLLKRNCDGNLVRNRALPLLGIVRIATLRVVRGWAWRAALKVLSTFGLQHTTKRLILSLRTIHTFSAAYKCPSPSAASLSKYVLMRSSIGANPDYPRKPSSVTHRQRGVARGGRRRARNRTSPRRELCGRTRLTSPLHLHRISARSGPPETAATARGRSDCCFLRQADRSLRPDWLGFRESSGLSGDLGPGGLPAGFPAAGSAAAPS